MFAGKKLVLGIALAGSGAAPGAGACTSPLQSEQAEDSVSSELSRCGRRPRLTAGCRVSCQCSGGGTGPYGETTEHYVCTPRPEGGQDCRLQVPRGDCSWIVTCEEDEEDDEERFTPPRRSLGGGRATGTSEP